VKPVTGCRIGRDILPFLDEDGARVLRAWLAAPVTERGNSKIMRDFNAQATGLPRLTERVVGAHRRGDCTCTLIGVA